MISLVEITRSNWQECVSLSVSSEQKKFVATNAYSLAESKYKPEWYPLGISKDGKLIGFAMYGYDDDTETPWVIRFMLDEKQQGKGFGKEAFGELKNLLFDKYGQCDIRLCVVPDNFNAIRFYESFGFISTGEIFHGQTVYELKNPNRAV